MSDVETPNEEPTPEQPEGENTEVAVDAETAVEPSTEGEA